jgi:hypothetical protein
MMLCPHFVMDAAKVVVHHAGNFARCTICGLWIVTGATDHLHDHQEQRVPPSTRVTVTAVSTAASSSSSSGPQWLVPWSSG